MIKCSNCGNTVYGIDVLDTEYQDSTYYDYVEGTCLTCGKMYNWVEVFTFDHAEDITEIKVNNHL